MVRLAGLVKDKYNENLNSRIFLVALFTGCFDGSVMVVTRFWRHAFQRGGNQENGDKEEEVDDGIGDLNTDEKDHCLHLKGSVTDQLSGRAHAS